MCEPKKVSRRCWRSYTEKIGRRPGGRPRIRRDRARSSVTAARSRGYRPMSVGPNRRRVPRRRRNAREVVVVSSCKRRTSKVRDERGAHGTRCHCGHRVRGRAAAHPPGRRASGRQARLGCRRERIPVSGARKRAASARAAACRPAPRNGTRLTRSARQHQPPLEMIAIAQSSTRRAGLSEYAQGHS